MEQDFSDWLSSVLNGGNEDRCTSLFCNEICELDIPDIPVHSEGHCYKKRKIAEQEERELNRLREQPIQKFREYIEFQTEIIRLIELQCGSVRSISGLTLIMNDPKNGMLQCHIHQNLSDGSIYLISGEQIRTSTRGRTSRCNYQIKCLAHLYELFNETIYRRSPLLDAIRTGDVKKFFSFVRILTLYQ